MGSHLSFLIDAKFFTLVFDGGRKDPYHIIEHRGNFLGSIWVSVKGLRWLIEVWDKLCRLPEQSEGYFQLFRDDYRTLELCCMKNKGGRFVEPSDYHSGSQQGHIRIPEGRKCWGWVSFVKEIQQFLLAIGSQPVNKDRRGVASEAVVPKISDRDPCRKSRQSLNLPILAV